MEKKKGILRQAVLGMLQTNNYLLTDPETGLTLIVDPGGDGGGIVRFCRQEQLRVAAILLTHGHFDHINGVEAIREAFGAPVYAARAEEGLLLSPEQNLSAEYLPRPIALKADILLDGGQEIEPAGFAVKTVFTPGHTAGGMCYYLPGERLVFTGDTLFRRSYGRTDLPTGSQRELERSVRGLLEALPEETEILPGHGERTSVGEERRYNPIGRD